MNKLSSSQLKAFSLAGVLCGLIPIVIFALWIHANSMTDGYPDNVDLFHTYFPTWLQGRWSTTYLSLVCCVLCLTACGVGLQLKNRGWRLANRIFIIIAAILMCLNLWSMM